MTDTPRRLEYMPLAELYGRRDPDNAKEHAAADLAASVGRFGYVEPVVLDERTGLLASGHGRIEELDRRSVAGETPPDGVLVGDDPHPGAWQVPVVRGWSSTSDDEATAWRIAANELTTAGGWDERKLVAQLDDLLATTRQLAGTGFDLDRLETLAASLGVGQLNRQDTDAAHADLPDRDGAGREIQGIHDVHLPFQDDAHRRYVDAIASLRRSWGAQLSAPEVVLRSLEAAVTAAAAAA